MKAAVLLDLAWLPLLIRKILRLLQGYIWASPISLGLAFFCKNFYSGREISYYKRVTKRALTPTAKCIKNSQKNKFFKPKHIGRFYTKFIQMVRVIRDFYC